MVFVGTKPSIVSAIVEAQPENPCRQSQLRDLGARGSKPCARLWCASHLAVENGSILMGYGQGHLMGLIDGAIDGDDQRGNR